LPKWGPTGGGGCWEMEKRESRNKATCQKKTKLLTHAIMLVTRRGERGGSKEGGDTLAGPKMLQKLRKKTAKVVGKRH